MELFAQLFPNQFLAEEACHNELNFSQLLLLGCITCRAPPVVFAEAVRLFEQRYLVELNELQKVDLGSSLLAIAASLAEGPEHFRVTFLEPLVAPRSVWPVHPILFRAILKVERVELEV